MSERVSGNGALREAIHGKWQGPLLAAALCVFALSLVLTVPKKQEPTVQERLAALERSLAASDFGRLYEGARSLREANIPDAQLGQVLLLEARGMVKEMQASSKFSLWGMADGKKENYQRILDKYKEAMSRGVADSVAIREDMAAARWLAGDRLGAIEEQERALALSASKPVPMEVTLIRMLRATPPVDTPRVLRGLDEVLAGTASEGGAQETYAWALAEKADLVLGLAESQPEKREVYLQRALEMVRGAPGWARATRWGAELGLVEGKALFGLGRMDEADAVLRHLEGVLAIKDDVSAEAALLLGELNYREDRPEQALVYFEDVARSQVGRDWYAGAKLGIAKTLARLQQYDEALAAYEHAGEILQKHPHNRAVNLDQLRTSLGALAYRLSLERRYATALRFLRVEQMLSQGHDAGAAARYAQMHVREARRLEAEAGGENSRLSERELAEAGKLAREHYHEAAVQFLHVAELTVQNDAERGNSLWDAGYYFDKAGDHEQAIEVLERWLSERPMDSRRPEAIYRLGRAYQALGDFDRAISYFVLNEQEHPQAEATHMCQLPLAQCYAAKGGEFRDQAIKVLRSIVDDNPRFRPESREFLEALFHLGSLYYLAGRYEETITALAEALDRYPEAAGALKATYLIADSYRKSTAGLDAKMSASKSPAVRQELATERRSRLDRAKRLFDEVIRRAELEEASGANGLAAVYLENAHLFRADCVYDLGQYEAAIPLYDWTSFRFPRSPVAMSAHVQIINCYLRLGRVREARTANELARWALKRIPDEAFEAEGTQLKRRDWEDWLDWLRESSPSG